MVVAIHALNFLSASSVDGAFFRGPVISVDPRPSGFGFAPVSVFSLLLKIGRWKAVSLIRQG